MFFSYRLRVALAAASLALVLAPTGCSTSSGCVSPPTPNPAVSVHAPCGLTVASIMVSGPCQASGGTGAPSVTGTGNGTCTVDATLANGEHATGSVAFTPDGNVCATFDPSPDVVDLVLSGSTGCDAGAASDAAAD